LKKFTLKLFLICSIFLILISTFTVFSFASSSVYLKNDEIFINVSDYYTGTYKNFEGSQWTYYENCKVILPTVEELSDFKYYCLVTNNGEFSLYLSTTPIIVSNYDDNNYRLSTEQSSGRMCEFIISPYKSSLAQDYYTLDDNIIVLNIDNYIANRGKIPTVTNYDYCEKNFIFSTYDILLSDTQDVVFQAAPQEGELTTIAKSIDFSTVLAEILGILPMTLLVLIGILSLMKAIKLLLQMLRKA